MDRSHTASDTNCQAKQPPVAVHKVSIASQLPPQQHVEDSAPVMTQPQYDQEPALQPGPNGVPSQPVERSTQKEVQQCRQCCSFFQRNTK